MRPLRARRRRASRGRRSQPPRVRRPAAFVLAAVEALAGADGRSGVPAGLTYGGRHDVSVSERGRWRGFQERHFVADTSATGRRRRGRTLTGRSDEARSLRRVSRAKRQLIAEEDSRDRDSLLARAVPLGCVARCGERERAAKRSITRLAQLIWKSR